MGECCEARGAVGGGWGGGKASERACERERRERKRERESDRDRENCCLRPFIEYALVGSASAKCTESTDGLFQNKIDFSAPVSGDLKS